MVTKSFTIQGTSTVQSLGQAFGTSGVKARSVQLKPDSLNSGVCLIGGSNIGPGSASPSTTSVGFPLAHTDAPLYLPYSSVWTDLYDFDNCYVYVEIGDNLHVLYEQG